MEILFQATPPKGMILADLFPQRSRVPRFHTFNVRFRAMPGLAGAIFTRQLPN